MSHLRLVLGARDKLRNYDIARSVVLASCKASSAVYQSARALAGSNMEAHLGSPHALSLPLYVIIQEADEAPDLHATVQTLQDGINKLHIEDHVHPVISFDEDREVLSVEPTDSFGEKICDELRQRFTFPPCPDDECEAGADGFCRWCGNPTTVN